MPFVKGALRPPNAGRKKGMPNKITAVLREEAASSQNRAAGDAAAVLTTVKGKSLRDGLRAPLDDMRVAAEQAAMLYEELLKALAENKAGKDSERKLLEMWNFRAIARSAMLEMPRRPSTTSSSEARSSL